MSPNVKKWVNRGGLVAVIVGFLAITFAGGDVSSAATTATQIATAASAILIAVRELLK